MKITNTTVINKLKIKPSTFYEWKKRDPRAIELIKKGLLYELIKSGSLEEEMIKKENKKGE